MKLPFELLFQIIDLCIEEDLKQRQYILNSGFRPTTGQVVLLNQGAYTYTVQNSNYHKLRLWTHLCQLPKQDDPIQLAVGNSQHRFTILKVEVESERVDDVHHETFLAFEEVMKRHCDPNKWSMQTTYIQQGKKTILPYFEVEGFLENLQLFTNINKMSIWLWKRSSNTLFTPALTKDKFQPILETQQNSLMAWDRPSPFAREGLTKAVMRYNTELFGRLL